MSWSSWFAGFVVGLASGLLVAEWPTVGVLIALAFVGGAVVSRHRLAAIGGLLLGTAGMWLFVIGAATARCASFDAQPGQECVMADLGPWGVVAAGVLAIGAITSVAAARR
jgi:hypothetical protein